MTIKLGDRSFALQPSALGHQVAQQDEARRIASNIAKLPELVSQLTRGSVVELGAESERGRAYTSLVRPEPFSLPSGSAALTM